MYIIINKGNTQDIKGSLHYSESRMTVDELEENIRLEKEARNRSTVIKMLEAAIKRKNRGNLS